MMILGKLFGDANEKYLKSLDPLVKEINALEQKFVDFTDADLAKRVSEIKTAVQEQGEDLDDFLAEVFALVREASKRTLKKRHYDVQLVGGIVLYKGQIAEMKTGEGKTLVATLPIVLNALAGKGVHVVTVNDYLAKRDAVWMGQIYNLLGLSVGILQHDSAFLYNPDYQPAEQAEEERDRGIVVDEKFLEPVPRAKAYLADITYSTNNELGFDYLRDNMVQKLEDKVQRDLFYAIVDEVDSILIDEARTPLIISGPAGDSTEKYYKFAQLVKKLSLEEDYLLDEKLRAVTLTEEGINKMEKALGVENIYEVEGVATVHHLEAALKAEVLFKKDKEYVIKDGEVIIVDEFTGRLMYGRRYSDGLHQAIEAKEGVKVQQESVTMATITFQNFFRIYKKLAGMTGTAATESEEFSKIYNLDVTVIPTNKPLLRKDENDLIYKNEEAKLLAVTKEIKRRNELGQPVLIGTISIEKNELLSQFLERSGVKHEILNAKNHEREALIIAQAGRKGAVTLATNMAGRGVDIVLGGNPVDEKEAEEVKTLGGLHVLGTERHESRRIDNQLRGRAGRQGDPGSSQFFVSLDDDLLRIFGSERIKGLMNTLHIPDDMPIDNKFISHSLESAQKKVEGNNFDIRKHLVEFDDVVNKHREVIYKKRFQILSVDTDFTQIEVENPYRSTKEILWEYLGQELDILLDSYSLPDDKEEFNNAVSSLLVIGPSLIDEALAKESLAPFKDRLLKLAEDKYNSVAGQWPVERIGRTLADLERSILLNAIDSLWIDHLDALDHLRTGIGLRGYGQRDPLVEYKKDSYQLFKTLLESVRHQSVQTFFNLADSALKAQSLPGVSSSLADAAEKRAAENNQTAVLAGHNKVGRNDPCPCGATKSNGTPIKYKHCHGK